MNTSFKTDVSQEEADIDYTNCDVTQFILAGFDDKYVNPKFITVVGKVCLTKESIEDDDCDAYFEVTSIDRFDYKSRYFQSEEEAQEYRGVLLCLIDKYNRV